MDKKSGYPTNFCSLQFQLDYIVRTAGGGGVGGVGGVAGNDNDPVPYALLAARVCNQPRCCLYVELLSKRKSKMGGATSKV